MRASGCWLGYSFEVLRTCIAATPVIQLSLCLIQLSLCLIPGCIRGSLTHAGLQEAGIVFIKRVVSLTEKGGHVSELYGGEAPRGLLLVLIFWVTGYGTAYMIEENAWSFRPDNWTEVKMLKVRISWPELVETILSRCRSDNNTQHDTSSRAFDLSKMKSSSGHRRLLFLLSL